MLNNKFLVVWLTLIVLNNFVWCDDYKNGDLPPRRMEGLHREFTKNQFYDVQIVKEYIPRITKDMFWEFGATKKLEIESCEVRTIEEGAFRRLKSVKKLSLRRNLLEEIKNDTFSDLEIEELDLSDNLITVIEANAFRHMDKLRRIKLNNNKIKVYNNKWFARVPRLCSINFENNLIKTLPRDVIGTPYHRDCSVDVFFSHNLIEDVAENFLIGAFRVNKLHLDHNAISVLPMYIFFYSHGIKYLRLDHNKIVCTTLVSMEHIENYNVDDNPWDPECLKAFKEGRIFQIKTTTTSTTTTTTTKSPTERYSSPRNQ